MYFEIASNVNSISVALTVAALLFVTTDCARKDWNTGDGGVQ
jgi:hypothetical protein